MNRRRSPVPPLLALAAGVLFLACSERGTLTDATVALDHVSGDQSHAVVCKTGSGASFSVTNGDVANISLNDGDCEQVATHDLSQTPLTVTVTETSADPGFMLDQVQIDDYVAFIDPGQLVSSTTVSGPGATADLIDDHVLVFTFTNVPIPACEAGDRLVSVTLEVTAASPNPVLIEWTDDNGNLARATFTPVAGSPSAVGDQFTIVPAGGNTFFDSQNLRFRLNGVVSRNLKVHLSCSDDPAIGDSHSGTANGASATLVKTGFVPMQH